MAVLPDRERERELNLFAGEIDCHEALIALERRHDMVAVVKVNGEFPRLLKLPAALGTFMTCTHTRILRRQTMRNHSTCIDRIPCENTAMAKAKSADPFAPREFRSIVLTFRLTPSEHKAMQAVAGKKRNDLVNLIREGVALAIAKRTKEKR